MTRESPGGDWALSRITRNRDEDTASPFIDLGQEDPKRILRSGEHSLASLHIPEARDLLPFASESSARPATPEDRRAWSNIIKSQLELLCPDVPGAAESSRRQRFRADCLKYFEDRYDRSLFEPLNRALGGIRATTRGNSELEGLLKTSLVMGLLRDLLTRDPPPGITRTDVQRYLFQNLTREQTNRLTTLSPAVAEPREERAVEQLLRLHHIPIKERRPRTDDEEAQYRALNHCREDGPRAVRLRALIKEDLLSFKRNNRQFPDNTQQQAIFKIAEARLKEEETRRQKE